MKFIRNIMTKFNKKKSLFDTVEQMSISIPFDRVSIIDMHAGGFMLDYEDPYKTYITLFNHVDIVFDGLNLIINDKILDIKLFAIGRNGIIVILVEGTIFIFTKLYCYIIKDIYFIDKNETVNSIDIKDNNIYVTMAKSNNDYQMIYVLEENFNNSTITRIR